MAASFMYASWQGGNMTESALVRRFQQYTTQQCEQCDNVKYVREAETLTVQVEPGMRNGQVVLSSCQAPYACGHVHITCAGHHHVQIRLDVVGSKGRELTLCRCCLPVGDLVLRAGRAHS